MSKDIGVIFDLDGVMVSTDDYHYSAWKKISDELHLDFDESINNQLRGGGRMESLDIILGNREMSLEEKTEFAEKKNDLYRESLSSLNKEDLLPGVMDFLTELKLKKIPMAIGSSSKNAVTILEKLGLSEWFDVIIDGTKISKSKPDPEVFIMAANAMNLSAHRCVVFEDAQAGVEAGIKGGMRVIGVGPAKAVNGISLGIESMNQIAFEDIEGLFFGEV